MTGFGRAQVELGGRRFTVEIRSVNHRGFDAKVKGHELDAACELGIIRAIRAVIERGAIVVNVRQEGAGLPGLDRERLRTLASALEDVRQSLALPGPVDLATVAAFMGHGGRSVEEGGDVAWEALRPAVEEALRSLMMMRAREGALLTSDLQGRMERIRAIVAAIGQAAAGLPTRAARRLEERLAALGPMPVDPMRLAQEVALLADKLDVSEELVRLGAHLARIESQLAEPPGSKGAAGRTMEFLLQEVGRELNTVGAKVADAQIAALVVEAKADLEKIREQAQNIE